MITRILNPGKLEGKNVFIKVVITDSGRLSIAGVHGPKRNGDAYGSWGQIQDTLLDPTLIPGPGWNADRIKRLFDIWQRWHLNDMRAECEHQRALGWTFDAHPSEHCPVCGYKCGSKWLREELPWDIQVQIGLFPETTVTPAWV